MAKSANNITVVADDDQSIYRWRGTSTSNVLKFTTEFLNVEKIVLTENYRSTQNILDSAYKLITHNNPDRLEIQAKIPKKLVSKKIDSDNFPVVHFHFSNSESEAEGIGSEIIKLKAKTTNLKYNDFAILVRANAYAESFIQAFERLGIPFQFLGPSRLFDKPEIKQLVSYLKLIVDSYDEASLFNVLSSPWVGLPGEVLSEILSISKHDRRPLILVAKESSDVSLKKFFEIFTHHRSRINSLSAGEILYDLLNQLDWLKHLILFESISDESIAANIIQFFNRLKSHQSSRADSSVPSVVNWIDFLVEAGESPQAAELTSTDNDAVNILTIHSSKGLEFEVVFLPCLVSLRFPSINRSEPIPIPLDLIKEVLPQGDAHLQEERRLFYVAMTRAKERLYLSSADYYGDAKRAKKPSIFISEALGPSHSVSLPKSDPIPRIIDVPVDTHPTIHKVDYLDYSRIQTFKSCPLHYKAKYILNLSTPPSASSTFGNIIHKTLKDYYENLIRSNPQDIHKLLDANWEHKGFGDPRRESLFVDKAHDMLQRFVENKSNFSSLPIKLEEPFKFKLSENLIIGGKIDRLDVTSDNKLHIFDYKTTSEKNQLDESEAASDLQLSVYALASTNLKHYPFNRKPQEILLSLYYLDTGERIDTTRTIDQLGAAIGEILDVQKQITESDFHCSKSYICKEGKCDYYDLCKSLVK
jgi:DNA helicase-2/ATP-dependent DNA helicase PcrA